MRTVYGVRDTTGALIAEHVRVDLPGGKKAMSWRVPGCDPRDGLMGMGTADLPLYGSEDVPSWPVGATVLVVEGEKPRDRLAALGIPSLGTVTGSSETPGEDALSALLPFDVMLWPDHDRVGWAHMNRVAWRLHRLGGTLPRCMPIVHRSTHGLLIHQVAPKGFDAADLALRPDAGHIVRRLLTRAERWDLHPEPPKPALRVVRPTYERYDDQARVENARSQLLEIVEARLGPPVRKMGRSLFWCCPFHSDRSPSFKVDLREPFYRCFGCDAKGDVFTFLREIEGTAFKDAIRELAPSTGIGAMPRLWG